MDRIFSSNPGTGSSSKKIEHFVTRKAMNINMGPETVEDLYHAGYVRNAADLYTLRTVDLLRLERWAEKSAQNLMDSLEASKWPTCPPGWSEAIGEGTTTRPADTTPSGTARPTSESRPGIGMRGTGCGSTPPPRGRRAAVGRRRAPADGGSSGTFSTTNGAGCS